MLIWIFESLSIAEIEQINKEIGFDETKYNQDHEIHHLHSCNIDTYWEVFSRNSGCCNYLSYSNVRYCKSLSKSKRGLLVLCGFL